MDPIHNIFDATSGLAKSKANIINKTIEIKGCTNSKDINILNQDLKNQELELLINVSKAKGVRSTRTFTMIYLNEYVKSKLIKLIETKLFNNPLKEKILKSVESTVTVELKLSIIAEKEMSQPNALAPAFLIASEIKEVK